MTCIVGAVDKDSGSVYLAADSAVSHGWVAGITGPNNAKMFRRGSHGKDEMLVGLTGYFRDTQILEYVFDPPYHRPDDSVMHYMVKEYVPAFRDVLVKQKRLVVKDDFAMFKSAYLLAYRGTLMQVGADLCVWDHSEIGYAVGSGQEIALGALYQSRNAKKLSVTERLTGALEAAANWIPSVAPPFHVEELRTGA